MLVPDEGCEYDQVVEINLDEVGLLSNDPFGGPVLSERLQIVLF